jgi:hypothetical protein
MLENRNHDKYPKVVNPVLIQTWQHNGELKLLVAMETHDIHVRMYIYIAVRVNNLKAKTHVWFRNFNSVSENVSSELAETRTRTVRQYHC